MKRRALLGSVGTALSVGLLHQTLDGREPELVVRVWRGERAATHEGVRPRVRGYLRAALVPVLGSVDVQFADQPVALPAEGGKRVLARYWPKLVAEGAAELSEVEPVAGVNLLVTDGDPRAQPAGYGGPGVAATTGASALARMPPAAETDTVVPYSVRAAATQLLLHECGHALGLGHDDGSASRTEDGVVASPMVGSYLWNEARERALDSRTNACGESYPRPDVDGDRYLGLRYADCAERALESVQTRTAAPRARPHGR